MAFTMSLQSQPSLKAAAERNRAICPDRVRQMQALVRHMQDLGVLKKARYGISPALGGAPMGQFQFQGRPAAGNDG